MKEPYNPTDRGITYLSVLKLKKTGDVVFASRVPADTEGSFPRVLTDGPNEGTTIHELYFSSITGVVEDVRINDESNYGARLLIFIKHVDEKTCIDVPLDSSYCRDFLNKTSQMKRGDIIKMKPYDFVSKATTEYPERHMVGFTIQIEGGENVKARRFEDKHFPGYIVKIPVWDPKNESNQNPDFLDGTEYTRYYFTRLTNWYRKTFIPAYRDKFGMSVLGVADAEVQTKREIEPVSPAQEYMPDDDLPF